MFELILGKCQEDPDPEPDPVLKFCFAGSGSGAGSGRKWTGSATLGTVEGSSVYVGDTVKRFIDVRTYAYELHRPVGCLPAFPRVRPHPGMSN